VSKDNTLSDAYSLILANPPFKGTIDKDSIAPGLKNVTDTNKTELLFLALMLRMLKSGGRCAVIVPDGVLFGSNKAYKSIRREIVENNKLEAVISMPGGVFKPYAGVSTAILIFTKTGTGGTDKVWFYDMKADGRSLDDKRSLLVNEDILNSLEVPEHLSEEEKNKLHENFNLPDIIARYPSRDNDNRERTEQSFRVPMDEIKANDWDLSINRYKEIVYEEVEYEHPNAILDKVSTLDKERAELQKKLEEMLKEQTGEY
jgi:type I restriction enzyme M protein